MTTKDDGGPAFPGPNYTQGGHRNGDSMGMSLRDWFAGQALAGYFACPSTPHQNATDCARYIYAMADAMLEARK